MRIRGRTKFWSSLVGPLGRRESAVVLVIATSAAARISYNTSRRAGIPRGVTAGLAAFDLWGGLVAFQFQPTREQYSRSPLESRMLFALVHVQPFLLPLLGEGSWRRATGRYATAVVSTAVLECFLSYSTSRRVVANGAAAALSAADLALGAPAHSWFGPVYLMKMIGGHSGIGRGDAAPGKTSSNTHAPTLVVGAPWRDAATGQ
ncbi:hypothetical protein H4W26_001930 [Nesterenkonia halotolerans]|uniref:Uncharacterized protein n=1 Tax=Nesterenkonia halotolerans TaxID=225325 RepID=A0ABR9J862_9MICC|nr:hypothetical protein [Nesterenkonia halotolerans]